MISKTLQVQATASSFPGGFVAGDTVHGEMVRSTGRSGDAMPTRILAYIYCGGTPAPVSFRFSACLRPVHPGFVSPPLVTAGCPTVVNRTRKVSHVSP